MKLPPPLSWFYEAWMEFSKTIGMIMSKMIVTVLWIIGLGIYAIVRRILLLFVQKSEAPGSSWIDVEPVKQDDLHHQF